MKTNYKNMIKKKKTGLFTTVTKTFYYLRITKALEINTMIMKSLKECLNKWKDTTMFTHG